MVFIILFEYDDLKSLFQIEFFISSFEIRSIKTIMSRNDIIKANCPIERVGNDKGHHFFGYYNKSVWDCSNRYILANRFNKMVKDVELDDELDIGYYDTKINTGKKYNKSNI